MPLPNRTTNDTTSPNLLSYNSQIYQRNRTRNRKSVGLSRHAGDPPRFGALGNRGSIVRRESINAILPTRRLNWPH